MQCCFSRRQLELEWHGEESAAQVNPLLSEALHTCHCVLRTSFCCRRNLFPPTQTSAELNALFATLGFGWLVGDMERKQGDIKVRGGGDDS